MAREANVVADGTCDHGIVAGQHDGVLDTHLVQLPDHRPALVADLVRIGNKPGKFAVDRYIEAGEALFIEAGAIDHGFVGRNVALAHEALIADMDVVAVDLALDPEAETVLSLVAGRNIDAQLARLAAQRFGDRMLKLGFGGGRQPQQVVRRDVVLIGNDVDHGRRAVGQGAGLVEHHGIDVGETLHMAAALDDHAGARGMRHRGQHRGRCGDADAGAEVNNNQRQETVEVAGHGRGADGERQRRRHQPVGKALGMVLHAGVADRRAFDQAHDLAGGRSSSDA